MKNLSKAIQIRPQLKPKEKFSLAIMDKYQQGEMKMMVLKELKEVLHELNDAASVNMDTREFIRLLFYLIERRYDSTELIMDNLRREKLKAELNRQKLSKLKFYDEE